MPSTLNSRLVLPRYAAVAALSRIAVASRAEPRCVYAAATATRCLFRPRQACRVVFPSQSFKGSRCPCRFVFLRFVLPVPGICTTFALGICLTQVLPGLQCSRWQRAPSARLAAAALLCCWWLGCSFTQMQLELHLLLGSARYYAPLWSRCSLALMHHGSEDLLQPMGLLLWMHKCALGVVW